MEGMQQTKRNRLPWWARLVMAASAAWACQHAYGLPAADRDAGLVDVLLTAGLYLLFTLYGGGPIAPNVKKRAAFTSLAFVLVLAGCGGWFSAIRYESFTDPFLYTVYYLNAFAGMFLLLYCGLSLVMERLSKAAPIMGTGADAPGRARGTFWLCFGLCMAIYLVFLLNQYPGSMESDHMRQLKSVLEARYDNRNPLVSSLLVLGCVRLAQAFGGSMNGGLFVYSIVQMTLMASVFAFGCSLSVKAGFPRWVTTLAILFYALTPYNIFYSYGMWKDSFFAAWMLLSIFQVWNVVIREKAGQRIAALHWAALAATALMCSLSRNSGWSALLAWTPFLYLLLRKPYRAVGKKLAFAVAGGVAMALALMGPVYSALGVEETADSITAACIPLQQVGAVLVAEKALTPEEEALIAQVVSIQAVKERFDPACADPMKELLYPSIETLDANLGAYVKLWLELGFRYPMTYLRAYVNQVRMYIDPNVSSETAYKWIYPNELGVYRDPKLLPSLDFGYYENWLELPGVNLIKRPGAILWAMVVLWQLCALRGNKGARLLYIPLLAVYGGLFLTVPVALFRYVYSAAACLPFLLMWPFWQMERAESKSEGMPTRQA